MAAYISSQEMPFVIELTDSTPAEGRDIAFDWMNNGSVLSLVDSEKDDETVSVLVNLGALPVVLVGGSNPSPDSPTFKLNGTDLH